MYYIYATSLIWLSEDMKWELLMPHLEFWKQIINHLPALHQNHQIIWKTIPCLITNTEYLPYFNVKFTTKCLTALWLSIAFSDTDLILQFCLSYNKKEANVLFYEDTLRCCDLPSPANRATANDIISHLTHSEDMTRISEPYNWAGR